jgi:predicted phage terminase large subunit-like protein
MSSTAASEKIRIEPQQGPQWDFLHCPADICIFGGSAGCGKSWALLFEGVRYSRTVPGFTAVIFRRTFPQIKHPGGLWDESEKFYPLLNGEPAGLSWKFPPHGCQVTFSHLQLESDKMAWHGAQIPLICWDELTHFTESQFWYLLSRNRSTCGVRPYVRATCNADAGSWVRELVDWYIAPDGYADLSRAGVVRWFVRDGDKLEWDDNREVLAARFPGNIPKSFAFIPASLFQNKILMEKDPAYLANLMSLPSVERQRLLGDRLRGGNWNIKAGTVLIKREWFEVVKELPSQMDYVCRFWDLAATDAKEGHDPDWTVGGKLGFKAGVWFVMDIRRVRQSPQKNEMLIKQTAMTDGTGIRVRMEQEGGSAGKSLIDHYARHILAGFDFKGIPATGEKTVRAAPFIAAAEAGNVKVFNAPWTKAFLDEMETFGQPGCHDDQVDTMSGAMSTIREMQNVVSLV